MLAPKRVCIIIMTVQVLGAIAAEQKYQAERFFNIFGGFPFIASRGRREIVNSGELDPYLSFPPQKGLRTAKIDYLNEAHPIPLDYLSEEKRGGQMNQFFGVRGKKRQEMLEMLKRRGQMNGFFGMRGKKWDEDLNAEAEEKK